MKKKITLLVALISLSFMNAQDMRVEIEGLIKNDSLGVSNIHVLNINTKKGVISNDKGEFLIEVKLNDTLVFSGIQFYTKKIAIEAKLIKSRYIDVNLVLDTNELDEVLIQNKLTGSLLTDAGKQKAPLSKVTNSALDFSIDFTVPYTPNLDEDGRKKSADNSQLTPDARINVLSIVGALISPIVKSIRRIGTEKRAVKRKEKKFKADAVLAMDKIREDFGDTFFMETLKIPKDHINLFIDYCKPKKIGEMYVRKNSIKLIEVFLEQSKIYKENNNLE